MERLGIVQQTRHPTNNIPLYVCMLACMFRAQVSGPSSQHLATPWREMSSSTKRSRTPNARMRKKQTKEETDHAGTKKAIMDLVDARTKLVDFMMKEKSTPARLTRRRPPRSEDAESLETASRSGSPPRHHSRAIATMASQSRTNMTPRKEERSREQTPRKASSHEAEEVQTPDALDE